MRMRGSPCYTIATDYQLSADLTFTDAVSLTDARFIDRGIIVDDDTLNVNLKCT